MTARTLFQKLDQKWTRLAEQPGPLGERALIVGTVLDNIEQLHGVERYPSQHEAQRDFNRRVRALRRVIRREIETLNAALRELSAFHAPSECGALIYDGAAARLDHARKQLGLTAGDIERSLSEYGSREAAAAEQAEYQNPADIDVPPAHHEWCFIDQMMSSY